MITSKYHNLHSIPLRNAEQQSAADRQEQDHNKEGCEIRSG